MNKDYRELVEALKSFNKSILELADSLSKNKHYDNIHLKHELHSNKQKKVEAEQQLRELDIKNRR